jgi:hypothetical protein
VEVIPCGLLEDPPPSLTWRDSVDEIDGRSDDRINVTGEIHLTGYALRA